MYTCSYLGSSKSTCVGYTERLLGGSLEFPLLGRQVIKMIILQG